MTDIKIIEVQSPEGLEEHVVIDRGNNEFTCMPKAVWDELEAAKEAQSLQIVVSCGYGRNTYGDHTS